MSKSFLVFAFAAVIIAAGATHRDDLPAGQAALDAAGKAATAPVNLPKPKPKTDEEKK